MITHTKGFEDLGFDLSKVNRKGQTTCPFCSHQRRKSRDKCAKIDMSTGSYICYHCGAKGRVDSNEWMSKNGHSFTVPKIVLPARKKKKEVILTGEDMKPLTEEAITYLMSRGFTMGYLKNNDKIKSMNYMFKRKDGTPDGRSCICYNTYDENKVLKSRKKRTISGKRLFNHEGSITFPFNYSPINYLEPIFLTEGEPDTLSMDMIGMQAWGLPVGSQEPYGPDTSIENKIRPMLDKGLESHPLVYVLLDPDAAGYYTSKKIVEEYLPNARNLTQYLNVNSNMDLNKLLQMGKLFDCLKYLINKI